MSIINNHIVISDIYNKNHTLKYNIIDVHSRNFEDIEKIIDNQLYKQNISYDTYIVVIKLKYNFEKKYRIITCKLDVTYEEMIWEYDWDEGEEDIEFLYLNCYKYDCI